MICAKIQELLISDYIDGEVDAGVRKAVDVHLASCPSCQEFWVAARETEDVLRSAPQTKLSDGVWDAVRERVTQPSLSWQERLGLIWEGPVFRPAVVFCASLGVAFFISGMILPVSVPSSGAAGLSGQAVVIALLDDVEELSLAADEAGSQTVVEDFFDAAGTFSG